MLLFSDLNISDEDLKILCLVEIQMLLCSNGSSLENYKTMPYPEILETFDYSNKLIADELNYDKDEMAKLHDSLFNKLTDEQAGVYKQIMDSVSSGSGGFFFLYGYGGTGKTFLWNTLSAALRSKGLIVLNAASSGIAALLLPGGRTAHSTFGIPLQINEESTCGFTKDSFRADLLRETKLIIWDEAPMMNRLCFECFNKSMQDIMSKKDPQAKFKPFGGITVVLGGDFRQILPVIRNGNRTDIVSSTINASPIWRHCRVLRLTANMRLGSSTIPAEEEEIKSFAKWILSIGDGDKEANEYGESDVCVPDDLVIQDSVDPLSSLVNFAYPDLLLNINNPDYFKERGILCPTLDAVEQINEYVMSMIPGEDKEYLSCDRVCRSDANSEIEGDWFTPEFLNDIKCSGIPNHKLKVKVGCPVMLMRNTDQSAGLCNGTRLIVTDLGKTFIGGTVITGKNAGDKVFIPRYNLIPTDAGLPFKFRRRQFPLTNCLAMTINKSQGQSLPHVGIYLPNPVFTHGQLYVALSRVKSRKGLKLLILDDKGLPTNMTTNVVYREVFENL
jgi:ATP-dependent DNA helicase PIF1